MDEDSIVGWALAGVASVVSVLAGSVAFLFKLNEGKNTKAIEAQQATITAQQVSLNSLKEDVEECREDRQDLRKRFDLLEAKLGRKD